VIEQRGFSILPAAFLQDEMGKLTQERNPRNRAITLRKGIVSELASCRQLLRNALQQ
jgi:hypothetical protein